MKRRKTKKEKTKDMELVLESSRELLKKSGALVDEVYQLEGDFSISTFREFISPQRDLGIYLKAIDQKWVTDNPKVKSATHIIRYEETNTNP